MERLYGIKLSNREGDALWGKNQFNSTFPASLCAYMRDKKINPVYIFTDANFNSAASDQEITFNEVFNTHASNDFIEFMFESNFSPYTQYLHDNLDHIDLVISVNGIQVRPLEVKLTVLPDSGTSSIMDERRWGSEIVIRPDSISYACLGIYHCLKSEAASVRKIIEPAAIRVASWSSAADIMQNSEYMISALTEFFSKYCHYQQPFLIQPIWKTQGKSPLLCEDAFDVFVWSDFALLKLAVDQAIQSNSRDDLVVSRYMRSVARTIKAMNELFTTGKIHVGRIFREMALGNQTDKEFALAGRITNGYMSHPRLITPVLKREVLRELILNGGEKKLSPERRFDATIYFTASHIFEGEG